MKWIIYIIIDGTTVVFNGGLLSWKPPRNTQNDVYIVNQVTK